MKKKNSALWVIVIVVAVVASLSTVAALLMRAKCRKKRQKREAEEAEGCNCMSFDVEGEAAESPVDTEEEDDNPQQDE